MREIRKAISAFPSRVDENGRQLILYGFGRLKFIINDIIDARTHAHIPMKFTWHYMRRALVTLVCIYADNR